MPKTLARNVGGISPSLRHDGPDLKHAARSRARKLAPRRKSRAAPAPPAPVSPVRGNPAAHDIPTLIGERLSFVRGKRGLSQQDVADAIGLPISDVVGLENDSRGVSTDELSRLGETLGCSEAFLLKQDYSDHNLFPVLCQVLSVTGHMNRVTPPEHRALDLCHEGERLRRSLGQPGTPALPIYRGKVTSAWIAVQQGGIVAQEERKRLGVGNGPLHDIGKTIGDQGIWVASIELPKHLSGLLVAHTAIGTAIFVNRGHGSVRQRFSYAHEYAHALFDRDGASAVIATRGENSDSLQEKRANAFAAAFLMPPDGIAERLMSLGKGSLSRQTGATFDVASGVMVKAGGRARPGSGTITHTLSERGNLEFELVFVCPFDKKRISLFDREIPTLDEIHHDVLCPQDDEGFAELMRLGRGVLGRFLVVKRQGTTTI